ncbi:sulfate adenylyltransferase [Haloarcula sp. CGMCC 1.2071]|uniref:sulfate adenylyltransferase n=1 Tax=Haloarcula sp. CGMCC 1.2071 TaxID=3111454 RepID=UPI00300EFCCF
MIPPHGNTLVDRYLDTERSQQLRSEFDTAPQITLDQNLFYDFVNLASGAYSPLKGFMTQHDFLKVVNDLSLESGEPWPLPIVLDVSTETANNVSPGERAGLRGPDGEPIGFIDIEEVYRYSVDDTCQQVFGTTDSEHPGVQAFREKKPFFIGGEITAFEDVTPSAKHFLKPAEARVLFNHNGWETVVGFQTRNVPHRAHEYLQKSALELTDGILIQPKIGEKKAGDYTNEAILSAYETLVEDYYPENTAVLTIFSSRMWYAGPREAIFDSIVRKNYGCTHFIVGRDHAGVGDYYGDFESQAIFDQFSDLGIEPLQYPYAFFCYQCDGVVSEKVCPHDSTDRVEPSGTELRRTLRAGEQPDPKLMRPEVAEDILSMDDVFVTD